MRRLSLFGLAVLVIALAGAPAAQAAAPSPTVAGLLKDAEDLAMAGNMQAAYETAQRAVALGRRGQNAEALADALAAVCASGVFIIGDEAIPLCEEAHGLYVKTLGVDNFKTHSSNVALANMLLSADTDRALALALEAAPNMERLARTPDEKSDAGAAWYIAALGYKFKSAYLDAIPPFEKAIALMSAPDAHPVPMLANVMTDFADMYVTLGSYEAAYELAHRGVEVRTGFQGPDAPEMADALGVEGDALRRMGRYDEAEARFRRSLKIAEATQPPLPTFLGRSYQNLGLIYAQTGRPAEAEVMFRNAITQFESLGDNGYQLSSAAYSDLAGTLAAKGDLRQAIEVQTKAVAISEGRLGRTNDRTLSMLLNLAGLQFKTGHTQEALALADEVTQARLKGPPSIRTADSLYLRAELRLDAGDLVAARADLEKAREILVPFSPNATVAIRTASTLARTLLKGGMPEDVNTAYDLAVSAARSQAYVLGNMERVQAVTGGVQTPADRRVIFDTVLDAAWRKAHAATPAK